MNDFIRARAKKIVQEETSDSAELMTTVAKDFGRYMGAAVQNGIPPELAFEAAREFFRIYGKAMIDFANLVTVEMTPAGDPPTPPGCA